MTILLLNRANSIPIHHRLPTSIPLLMNMVCCLQRVKRATRSSILAKFDVTSIVTETKRRNTRTANMKRLIIETINYEKEEPKQ